MTSRLWPARYQRINEFERSLVDNGVCLIKFFLNVSRETAASLPAELQALLGYACHDASDRLGGMVGLYEGGDPAAVLA